PSAVASVFELIKDPAFGCPPPASPHQKGIPENVSNALAKMLRKNRSDRYATILEALTDLLKEPAQACSKCGAVNPLTSRFCSQLWRTARRGPDVWASDPSGDYANCDR